MLVIDRDLAEESRIRKRREKGIAEVGFSLIHSFIHSFIHLWVSSSKDHRRASERA